MAINHIMNRVKRWQSYHEAVRTLRGMDQHGLDDLGILPSQIETIVRRGAL